MHVVAAQPVQDHKPVVGFRGPAGRPWQEAGAENIMVEGSGMDLDYGRRQGVNLDHGRRQWYGHRRRH